MRIASTALAPPSQQSTNVEPEQIRRELENLFPGVRAWFGVSTGHWWALLGDRLLEADSPRQLAEAIRAALAVRHDPSIRPGFDCRPTTGVAVRNLGTRACRAAASVPGHARPKRRGHVLGRIGGLLAGRASG